MLAFARSAHTRGIRVIIAGAGGAAHLPGMVAALTPLPVVGVPVTPPGAHTDGLDALLSIVQMPRGVPVATVAIGNAANAGAGFSWLYVPYLEVVIHRITVVTLETTFEFSMHVKQTFS